MTIAETLVSIIVAVGSAGGGIALAVKAFRERHGAPADRESPVPQDRSAERARCVTHADLAAALAQHRAEVAARIDAAEADCERRVQDHARHGAEQSRDLAEQIRCADGKVERALGMLEVLVDGQAAHSRRGR
jgi:hypothetical protein